MPLGWRSGGVRRCSRSAPPMSAGRATGRSTKPTRHRLRQRLRGEQGGRGSARRGGCGARTADRHRAAVDRRRRQPRWHAARVRQHLHRFPADRRGATADPAGQCGSGARSRADRPCRARHRRAGAGVRGGAGPHHPSRRGDAHAVGGARRSNRLGARPRLSDLCVARDIDAAALPPAERRWHAATAVLYTGYLQRAPRFDTANADLLVPRCPPTDAAWLRRLIAACVARGFVTARRDNACPTPAA